MSALPKPVLRGHIKRRGLKALVGALCVAAINGSLYHFLVAAPRKEAHENFRKTYDAEAHYKDLVKWGYISIHKAIEEMKNS